MERGNSMTTYLVGYDLGNPGRDYDGLSKYLKSFGAWWHNLDSTWLIVTDASAVEVRDGAGEYLDSSDKLLVARVTAPGAWRGIGESGSEWLQKYL
jgi:hypothetical protein